MADLIDRQAAIDALDKRFDSIPTEQTTEILMLRRDLRELPTVTERTGQWIEGAPCDYKCSACGDRWTTSRIEDMHYCPHCGAHMTGGVTHG